MHKNILITGICASGKSAVCDELKKLGHNAHSIEDIKGICTLVNKKTRKKVTNHDNDNLKSIKDSDWICRQNKLKELMRANPKGTVFYCGIVSNLNDILPLFDKIFLLRTNQKVLRKRLSTRKSNDFGRTPEVQKWVFSWKKSWEDNMRKKGAIFINANRTLREIATDIIERSK